MYLWVAVPTGEAAEAVALRLLEHGVIVSPGTFFGPSGEGYVRFALVPTARGVRAGGVDPEGAAVTTEETIAALDRGEIRVAERVDGEWQVNEEAKAAILDYFRVRSAGGVRGRPVRVPRQDPAEADYAELGVRVVPPATARYGSFLSPRRGDDAELREHRRLGRAEHDGRHLGDRRLVRADRRRRASGGRRRRRRRARAGAGAAGDRRGRRVHRLALHPHRGRRHRRARRAGAERLAHGLGAGDRRHRPGAGRAPGLRAAAAPSSFPGRGRRSFRPARTSSAAR